MTVSVVSSLLLQVLLLAVSVAQVVRVPVRLASTVSSDLSSIEHDLAKRHFRINLHAARKCINPTFLLRLSGAALYKLERVTGSNAVNLQTYSNPALVDAGQYHLDVTILFCAPYDPNNQTSLCLEDASNGQNVINEPYSFTVNTAEGTPQPRWKNNGDQVLVPTRYQMHITEARSKGLSCAAMYDQNYCITEQTIAQQYRSYSWTDDNTHHWLSVARSVKLVDASLSPTTTGKINICLVGDSHARELFFMAQKKFSVSDLVTFTFVTSIFPLTFSADQLQQNLCSVAVLAFGQWSLSPYTVSPVTIDAIKSELQAVFADIAGKEASTRVFFRTENYNGLGAHIRLCPNQDHRTPPAFDAINNAVRQLCEESKGRMPFIDLSAVIGPMWDAAVDFCHPDAPVLHAEVEVILHAVFSHLRDQGLTVCGYTSEQLAGNAAGRSTDPNVVDQMFHAEKKTQWERARKLALEKYGFVPARDSLRL
jgi:hypothetical protein